MVETQTRNLICGFLIFLFSFCATAEIAVGQSKKKNPTIERIAKKFGGFQNSTEVNFRKEIGQFRSRYTRAQKAIFTPDVLILWLKLEGEKKEALLRLKEKFQSDTNGLKKHSKSYKKLQVRLTEQCKSIIGDQVVQKYEQQAFNSLLSSSRLSIQRLSYQRVPTVFWPAILARGDQEFEENISKSVEKAYRKVVQEKEKVNRQALVSVMKSMPLNVQKEFKKVVGDSSVPTVSLFLAAKQFEYVEMNTFLAAMFRNREFTYRLDLSDKQAEALAKGIARINQAAQKKLAAMNPGLGFIGGQGSRDGEVGPPQTQKQYLDFLNQAYKELVSKHLHSPQIRSIRMMAIRSSLSSQTKQEFRWPLLLEKQLKLTQTQRNRLNRFVEEQSKKVEVALNKLDEEAISSVLKVVPMEERGDIKEMIAKAKEYLGKLTPQDFMLLR